MIKKIIARFLSWALKDEILKVGSVAIQHPKTMYTDTIVEKTINAGVSITYPRPDSGTTFPIAANSHAGQLFFKYTATPDDGSLYVFYGVGREGCNADGWFKLDNAYYGA